MIAERFPNLAAILLALCSPLIALGSNEQQPDGDSDEKKDTPAWDIENPPGPTRDQPIDVTEGTWVSLDISPDGKESFSICSATSIVCP